MWVLRGGFWQHSPGSALLIQCRPCARRFRSGSSCASPPTARAPCRPDSRPDERSVRRAGDRRHRRARARIALASGSATSIPVLQPAPGCGLSSLLAVGERFRSRCRLNLLSDRTSRSHAEANPGRVAGATVISSERSSRTSAEVTVGQARETVRRGCGHRRPRNGPSAWRSWTHGSS